MKSKTNILYIFHVSSIGGGSFCLLNIIKELDKTLFNPIILLKESGPLCNELEKYGATVYLDNTICIVPYNRSIFELNSIIQIFSVLLSLKNIRCWIKKTDADIVHINTMMMYPYIHIAHKLGKKVVAHVREHWPKEEHQIQFKLAKKIIQRYSDKIIAINEASAEMIGITQKTYIIYDWIDFENRDTNVNFIKLFGDNFKSLKIFLFLGGTNWIKGAFEVVSIFSSQILSKDARLLLVGCDKKDINYIGIKGFVKKTLSYLNYHTYSNKVKLLAQKDDRIVFIPSTYHVKSLIEQSFCVVSFFTIPHANLPIAEATWLGKPSIAANTPEAKEYSDGGQAALLFTINDKEDFKTKILFALKNEELINRNATNGMSNIREKFDPTRNSKLLNRIYKDLIS